MKNTELSIPHMLQELIITHMFTKREIADSTKMSIHKLNKILLQPGFVSTMSSYQITNVLRLYQRVSCYPPQITSFYHELVRAKAQFPKNSSDDDNDEETED
jgi:hypothetical protein